MYMMFLYVDRKIYNSMGIRVSLEELIQQVQTFIREILNVNPHSIVEVKMMKYI